MKIEEYINLSNKVAANHLNNLKEYVAQLTRENKIEKEEQSQLLLSLFEGTLLVDYIRLNMYNHLTAKDKCPEETQQVIDAVCLAIGTADFLLKSLLSDSALVNIKGMTVLEDVNVLSGQLQEITNREVENILAAQKECKS